MAINSSHESLFKAWIETHRGIIRKVTRSYARTSIDEADLQQEIQLQLWKSLDAYLGQAKESTWIYRVCLNTALAWRRSARRRDIGIDVGLDMSQVAGEAASPAESAGQKELIERLYAAIHRMDDFDRALVLLMLDGLSYIEISEVMGLTENHVGVALTRARKRLATLMKGVIDELE